MQSFLALIDSSKPLRVLCLGAHCDDIEIGCGAALLRLTGERPVDVTWAVLCSTPPRAAEVHKSASRFLRKARVYEVLVEALRDGYLPAQWAQAKDTFESLKRLPRPDLIFTHEGGDRHQDHRVVCELTWNTFRDHTILEYEVPKYDGGLGQPNFFVPVSRVTARRKANLLLTSYPSQRSKRWFDEETFLALMRLRGVECNATPGYAEAFHAHKVVM
jgi:LmbE family N-acetylglucosaminyl deacetylase